MKPAWMMVSAGIAGFTIATAGPVQAANVPVHVPLSGKTMEFDGAGKCVAGC